MRKLLAHDGRLIITTPNASGLNSRLLKGRWRGAQNPVHLVLFTQEGLSVASASAGLCVGERHTEFVDFGHQGLRRLTARLLTALGLDGSLRVVVTGHR